MQIIAVARGSMAGERFLHKHFADLRLPRSEWFRYEQPLIDLVRRLPKWEEVRNGARCPTLVVEIDTYKRLRKVGYTYQEIGDYFGVSRQRIHQQTLSSADHISETYIPDDTRPPIAEFICNHPGKFLSSLLLSETGEAA